MSTNTRRVDAGSRFASTDALCLRHAHAERTGVGLDVRRLDVRMPRQSVQPAQLVQHVFVEQAEADQHVVERRRVVALRREEDVALGRRPCRDRGSR